MNLEVVYSNFSDNLHPCSVERSPDVGLISITGTSQADRSQPQSFTIRQSVSGANSSCNAGVTRQGACPNVIMMPSHVLVSSRCRVTMSLSLPNICALRWLSPHNPEIGIAPVISVYGLCRLEPSSNNQFLLLNLNKARLKIQNLPPVQWIRWKDWNSVVNSPFNFIDFHRGS